MTGTFTNGPALTLDDIRKAMELVKNLPPAPFFASSTIFPRDHALRFKMDDTEYVCAHPRFWTMVPAHGVNNPVNPWSIPIHDIDSPVNEAKRKQVLAAMRKKVAEMCGTVEPGA